MNRFDKHIAHLRVNRLTVDEILDPNGRPYGNLLPTPRAPPPSPEAQRIAAPAPAADSDDDVEDKVADRASAGKGLLVCDAFIRDHPGALLFSDGANLCALPFPPGEVGARFTLTDGGGFGQLKFERDVEFERFNERLTALEEQGKAAAAVKPGRGRGRGKAVKPGPSRSTSPSIEGSS